MLVPPPFPIEAYEILDIYKNLVTLQKTFIQFANSVPFYGKTFLNNDVTHTRTLLHEAIPLTGTIVSGTYNSNSGDEFNIKNYSHGIFQSVYDYPYLSSSANHIMDITAGYSTDSALSGTTARVQQAKKINIYNQMAQVLMGILMKS